MEDMFVWMLIFAGATIGLLGTFLISSERELKKKRLELESFAAKLEMSPGVHEEAARPQPSETESETELIARNEELADEVASLTSRLQSSEANREELASAQDLLAAARLENAELRQSIEQLEKDSSLLQSQLNSSHAQLSQSGDEHQTMSAHCAELEAKNTALREEIQQSQRTIQTLESMQAQWRESESREPLIKERQQRLESEIADLHRELSAARQSLEELEATRSQLKQSETVREQLADDHRRLQQEISGWQERLAESEERRRQLSAFRYNLEDLRIKQAAATESNRQLQEELEALARLIDTPETALNINPGAANGQDIKRSELHGNGGREILPELSNDSGTAPAPDGANATGAKKRLFGIFSPMLAFAIGSSLGMILLR